MIETTALRASTGSFLATSHLAERRKFHRNESRKDPCSWAFFYSLRRIVNSRHHVFSLGLLDVCGRVHTMWSGPFFFFSFQLMRHGLSFFFVDLGRVHTMWPGTTRNILIS